MTPSAKTKGTVLWVDDDAMVLDCGAKTLKLLGYDPLTTPTGASALKLYATNRDAICLVVLDMMMPQMDGYEVYKKLSQMNPDVKVLIVTGYSDSEFVKGVLERDGIDFIQKPFTLQILQKKIDVLLSDPASGVPQFDN